MSNNSKEIKISPIVIILGIIAVILFIMFYKSPKSQISDCVKDFMEEGYNYEDAKSACEDGYWDSKVR